MELLTQLIRQLSVPAQLWRPTGDVLCTNTRFNALLGLPPDFDWAAAGRRFVDDPQLAEPSTRELLQRGLAGAPVDLISVPYRPQATGAPSQDTLRLMLRLRPLATDDELAAVLCLVTDYAVVGERLEHDLMRSQKMENVETLAGGIAHEFNNLFTGIRGLTELISDTAPAGSEVREYAALINRNVTRGSELIDKLSSFARELPHSLRRMSLNTYLGHSLPLLQLQVPRRMKFHVEQLEDREVLIDPHRLDQALANILANARDATGGSGEARLLVECRPPSVLPDHQADCDWIMFALEDSGPGIPPELRERVLEPFFSTKDRGKATGLGLSMTKRIVAMHDGVIEIGASKALGGAAVCVFLPVAPPPAPDPPQS